MNDPIEILEHDHCVPIEKYTLILKHEYVEKYTLILKHEYVDKNGKYLVDQPLMVSAVTPLQKGMSIVPIMEEKNERRKRKGMLQLSA